jgi:hypothetical protein
MEWLAIEEKPVVKFIVEGGALGNTCSKKKHTLLFLLLSSLP